MFTAAATAVNEAVNIMSTIGDFLASVLFPPTCCMCGAPGLDSQLDLCHVCFSLLPRNPAGGSTPAVFSRVLAPFEYAYPIDRFIRALKFHGHRVYARVLGALLARSHQQTGRPLPQLLIPVPLHAQRYRQRGFNQANEIARFAAACLGLRVDSRCLLRAVPTREQSGLTPVERRRNVRRAFRLIRPTNATHVALIDDVVTTGSTAAEAAGVLDAPEIELWVAARVPPPR